MTKRFDVEHALVQAKKKQERQLHALRKLAQSTQDLLDADTAAEARSAEADHAAKIARDRAREAHQDSFRSAQTAGWSDADLAEFGFHAVDHEPRRDRTQPAHHHSDEDGDAAPRPRS